MEKRRLPQLCERKVTGRGIEACCCLQEMVQQQQMFPCGSHSADWHSWMSPLCAEGSWVSAQSIPCVEVVAGRLQRPFLTVSWQCFLLFIPRCWWLSRGAHGLPSAGHRFCLAYQLLWAAPNEACGFGGTECLSIVLCLSSFAAWWSSQSWEEALLLRGSLCAWLPTRDQNSALTVLRWWPNIVPLSLHCTQNAPSWWQEAAGPWSFCSELTWRQLFMISPVCSKGGAVLTEKFLLGGGWGSKTMKSDSYKCSVSSFRSHPEFQLG